MTPAIAVLGGGSAGVVAAAHLARSGNWRVDLYEAADALGGLHQSPLVDGVPFDIGAFIFTPDHEYFSTFPGLAEKFVRTRYRRLALRASGAIDRYPISVRGYARERGLRGLARDLLGLARCKLTARRRRSFREYCHYYLGPGIYERSGLRIYAERLYALPDDEISVELARSRLAAIASECSWRRLAWRPFDRARARRHDPGWDFLVRPPGGFQEVYAHIRGELERAGVRVVTGARLQRIAPVGALMRLTLGDEQRDYAHVLSTIPMEAAAALRGVALAFVPPTMQLVSLFYRHHGALGFDANCLFNYSFDGEWKRITMQSNHPRTFAGEHRFTVECTAPANEMVDVGARQRAFEAHVARWRVLPGRLEFRGGCVTSHAYPVYRAGEEAALRASRAALQAAGLSLAGRQGRFEYLSSAAVAERARALAASLHHVGASPAPTADG